MLHRTSSSRRRRASRSAATSPQARSPRSSAQPSRRASLATTETDDELDAPPQRSPRASLAPDAAMDLYHRSPRHSLVPDAARSPRNSMVPETALQQRNSLAPSRNNLAVDVTYGSRQSLNPGYFNRSPRNSITPDMSARSPRRSLVPEGTTWNQPRNSLVPDVGRSPRHSVASIQLDPERNQKELGPSPRTSPRGSIAPDTPIRVKDVPEMSRTHRGSLVPDPQRSPRGSIAPSERSARGSLVAGELEATRVSPRGSFTLTFQEPLVSRERRASEDSQTPATRGRSVSPYRASLAGRQGAGVSESGSRRASSSVSQVSGDEQRRLCGEQAKYNERCGLGLGVGLTTYGSVAYQLKDANMEATSTMDFVCRAAKIMNRTSTSGVKVMTREDVFRMTKDCEGSDFVQKLDAVENKLTNSISSPQEQKDFLHKFSNLKSQFKSRWQASNRTEQKFLKKNEEWLKGTLEIPLKHNTVSPGRPRKDFENVTDRSKRRKTEDLRQTHDASELLYAGQMVLREAGNSSAANVVRDVMASPHRGEKYLKALKKSETIVSKTQLTPSQALSMFVEASLTRKQYEIIRLSDKTLYPCYTILQKAKKECYPNQEAYRVTATCAEVNLQDLLNHTVERLLLYLEDVLVTLSVEELADLDLIVKWGCDGSQQAQFKQKFENSNDSDANIFQSSMVPLQLICRVNNKVIWQNQTPSSPRFCRPMRIRFIHETTDVTTEEISYFNHKIGQLQATKITKGDKEVSVKHTMLMTMVDGKVCNAATDTKSTRRCYICKTTSKDFNKLIKPQESEIDNLQFGLSVLHARIRFFETLLHLSYKLPIKKWQQKLTNEEQEIMRTRKLNIQAQFKEKLGLIVDIPKQGFGTSNDGNTSRRFFSNAEISSSITEIDVNLIKRFATVLEVISSGQRIDLTKFEAYCDETAKLYVELYPWQPMTPTVHKILVHGPAVIKHALLPIGNLSEEAAEARNKHFRQYRQKFSRKFSREQCNMDVLNRLLLTSDPFLSSIRPRPPKTVKSFSTEAKNMMLAPDLYVVTEDESEEETPSDFEVGDDVSDEEGWGSSSE